MELPLDYKCPALRVKVSSGVPGSHGGVENSDNVAAVEIRLSKSKPWVCRAGDFGSVTLVIFPCSVAVALWGVSRLPERSSLLATLDPRLAPNTWVYLNKLLDLPRTPLRTVRTAAGYVLALAGAFLLIAAAMYLLTVGGTSNKLAALATICNDKVMTECVAISAAWARRFRFGSYCRLLA